MNLLDQLSDPSLFLYSRLTPILSVGSEDVVVLGRPKKVFDVRL